MKKTFLYEFRTRRYRRRVKDRLAHYTASSVTAPEHAATICRSVTDGEARELFVVIFLDTRHHPVGYEIVAIGGLDSVAIHPREVFRTAILSSAHAIIVAHNHPSGSTTPSPDDRLQFQALREIGEILGVPVLDSVVVSETGFFSIAMER